MFLCRAAQVPFPFISQTLDFLNAELIHPLIEKSVLKPEWITTQVTMQM